jgi:hypothetical protein
VVETAEQVFAESDMIVKVKEPQPHECRQLRPKQLLFTYLHLAADPLQAELLMNSGATCIAYETITSPQGRPALVGAYESCSRQDSRCRQAPTIWKFIKAATVRFWAASRVWHLGKSSSWRRRCGQQRNPGGTGHGRRRDGAGSICQPSRRIRRTIPRATPHGIFHGRGRWRNMSARPT